MLFIVSNFQLGQMVVKQELVKVVKKEVVRIWETAGYKMVGDEHVFAKIEKLVNKYQALLKDIQMKREQWAKKVEVLFDIGAADAMEVLQKNWLLNPEDKKEDKAFLLDQRTKRLQHIGQKD